MANIFNVLKEALSGRDLIGELSDKENELSSAKADARNLSNEKKKLENELSSAKTDARNLSNEKEKLEDELSSAKADARNLSNEKEKLEDELVRNKRLCAAYKSVRTRLNNKCSQLETTLSNTNNQLAEVCNANNELQEENAQLTSQIIDLTDAKGDTEEELKKLREEVKTLEFQVQSLEETILDKESEIQIAEGRIGEKDTELQNATNQLSEIRNANHELQEKNEELTTQIADLTDAKGHAEEDLRKLREEVKTLETHVQSSEETIQDKERELQIAKGKIEEKDTELQNATNELSKIRNANHELQEKNEELTTQIVDLTDAKERAAEEIKNLREERDNLENLGKQNTEQTRGKQKNLIDGGEHNVENQETEGNLPQQGTETDIAHRGAPIVKKDKIKEIDELSGGCIEDFPEIINDSSQQVKRTIRQVKDENGKIIDADEFFTRTSLDIAMIARQLAEADIIKSTFWSCATCGGRVRIAKRKHNGVESLFFTHVNKDTSCEWRTPTDGSRTRNVLEQIAGDLLEDEAPDSSSRKLRELKDIIYTLLLSERSKERGIGNVQMDNIIKSQFPYMKWRRPDLSFTYKKENGEELKMVIQLQRSTQSVDNLADKDIFYRLNDIHIIWIFGCDNDNTYEYLNTFPYKNTLFHNHRNVFVFDKEAQEESQKCNELVFKCNWLNVDDDWEIKLDKDGSNGRLVTMGELTFDNEYCKPYYIDANTPYFEKNPKEKREYERALIARPREDLLAVLEERWTKNKQYEGAQRNMRSRDDEATPYLAGNVWGFRYETTTLIQPIFTEKPQQLRNGCYVVKQGLHNGMLNKYAQKVIDWDGTFNYDIHEYDERNETLIVCSGGMYGVANRKGNILIDTQYESIQPWDDDTYKVEKDKKWALCNTHNEIISLWYDSIGDLSRGKTEAAITLEGDWRQFKGFINAKGEQIVSKEIPQPLGGKLIEKFERWGLVDSGGKELLPCEYEEISLWCETLYRVKKGIKWGVVNVETQEIILPIEYDALGDIVDGAAIVEHYGRRSRIGIDGQELAEKTIHLQDKLLKVRKSGKWGIFGTDGNEIISPKYDEIGTFRSRFIGVINGHIIKLNAYYSHPIYVSGTLVSETEKWYIFDIAGVKFFLNKNYFKKSMTDIKEISDSNGVCHKLAFQNLVFSRELYQLRVLHDSDLNKSLTHGDKDSDFSLNNIYTGTISDIYPPYAKTKRKLLVSLSNGLTTMVPIRFLKKVGKNIDDYPIGSQIILQKVGFNDELDQTIWEIKN